MATWTNSDGYLTAKHPHTGRLHKCHAVIYRLANGTPPPRGWHIHHRDENKRNNQPANLQAMPWDEHKRIHCGHRWSDDRGWLKTCRTCGVEQPETEFPTKRYVDGQRKTRGNCRACDIARVRRVKNLAR